MTLRPARPEDAPVLAEIHAESLAARDASMEIESSTRRFTDLLEGLHPREALLVLEEDGVPVGWGQVKRYSERPGYRVAAETSIYLRRDRVGAGRGTVLQKALLERCRQLGYHHLVARVWASNEASLAFHYKFGYELVGIQREVGYLAGAWRDVAILQCLLRDVPPYQPDLA